MGEGHFANRRVYVVAQQKPKPEQLKSAADVAKLNWGMLTSAEHSQVLAFMNHHTAHLTLMRTPSCCPLWTPLARTSPWNPPSSCMAFFIAHLIRAYLTAPIRTMSVVLGRGRLGRGFGPAGGRPARGSGRRPVCHPRRPNPWPPSFSGIR